MADLDVPASSSAVRATAFSLLLDSVAADVVEGFARAGIPSILLKGAAIARWLYDDGATRSYADIDLLVAPSQVAPAEEVLSGRGFELVPWNVIPHDRPWYAVTWVRRNDGVTLELHRTLVGVAAPPEDLWKELFAQTERMHVGGRQVNVLAPAARALHVVLHAAQEGVEAAKPLADLERALDRLPEESWREAASLAGGLEATEAFAAGLRLSPEGRLLATRLGLGETGSIETILRSSVTPNVRARAIGFDWLVQRPGLRAKAAFVTRKIFPPVEFMRAWSSLAHRGPVGLAAAYAARPVWLLRHTAPAVRAWWSARRALRSGRAE